VPRRGRPLSVTAFFYTPLAVLGLAALMLDPAPVTAQTTTQTATARTTTTQPAQSQPDPYAELLQPSLQGNAGNPPVFLPGGNSTALPADQAPPTGQFTAPSRIGTTPVYGSPTGFGAGDTGFDSSNRPKRQRTARVPARDSYVVPPDPTFDPVPAPPPQVSSQPPILAPPPAPVVYPAKAAARPGAILPSPPDLLPISNPPAEVHPLSAASRPGAVLPIPPAELFAASASTPPPGTPPPNTLPLGTVPQRTLPFAAGDPYEALGIRAGSFLILPALELSGGFNNNPQHAPGGPGSAYYVVAPELHVRSNWASNSLTADVTGSYTGYQNDSFEPSISVPYLNAKMDGTLDVTRYTQILLELRDIVSTDNPGSPNIQAGLAKLPIDNTFGGTAGLDQQFGRIDLTLKGTFDRSTYANSELTDGTTASNDWRAFDQYAGILRLGYAIDPGVKPFVEVSGDTRNYDSPVDIFGENRNSTGISGKGGATIAFTDFLTGEMAVGYLERNYPDPALPNIGGLAIDGSLIWLATALTTAKFTATTVANESTLQGVSGSLSRDLSVQVDHAFRTWLVGTAQAGYGNDDYVGLGRDDNRYFASLGLTYKFNREVQLRGTVREDWLNSNVSGVAYTATSFLLTLRLQR
jgi:hypothetical protein